MGWMSFGWVFVLGAIAFVIWLAINMGQRTSKTQDNSPEKILKERYARGEIDRETYERMLADLRK